MSGDGPREGDHTPPGHTANQRVRPDDWVTITISRDPSPQILYLQSKQVLLPSLQRGKLGGGGRRDSPAQSKSAAALPDHALGFRVVCPEPSTQAAVELGWESPPRPQWNTGTDTLVTVRVHVRVRVHTCYTTSPVPDTACPTMHPFSTWLMPSSSGLQQNLSRDRAGQECVRPGAPPPSTE